MAKLRVFVSSTCYDLGIVRSELRPFISSLGYEPVMSDYSDVLFDPRSHTHESCIKEVPNCDMVVLIIGSRFGGTGIPSALEEIDFEYLRTVTTKADLLEQKFKFSITQLEILKAAEQSIPVYAFVDEKVLHDHHVYEKNKNKPAVMKEIIFPSIQKNDTAEYIFEFINFLTHRTHNNSLSSFSKLDDIKNTLTNQWSQLFQRLLFESKTRSIESKRYIDFSERLDDLKAVVMASIATPNLRDTARGAIQFRHLISFISSFDVEGCRELLISTYSWNELMDKLGLEIRKVEVEKDHFPKLFFVKKDGTYYRTRFHGRFIEDLEAQWADFISIDKESREAIVVATLQDRSMRRRLDVQYVNQQFGEYLAEIEGKCDPSEENS